MNKYVAGCIACQKFKYLNQKKLTEPLSLYILERMWGAMATEFILEFPNTNDVID